MKQTVDEAVEAYGIWEPLNDLMNQCDNYATDRRRRMKQTINEAVEAKGKEQRKPVQAECLPSEVHPSTDAIFEIAIFFA